MTDQDELARIEEGWALVDELGELSLRLKVAAENARKCLRLPDEEDRDERP